MTGFLDFRHHNSKISMKAREIRKMIKAGQCPLNENYKPQDCKWTRVPGSLSVSSPNFSKNLPIRNLRDILPIMTFYDDFLESQINCNQFNDYLIYYLTIFFKQNKSDGFKWKHTIRLDTSSIRYEF